jgi:hypothetical protein
MALPHVRAMTDLLEMDMNVMLKTHAMDNVRRNQRVHSFPTLETSNVFVPTEQLLTRSRNALNHRMIPPIAKSLRIFSLLKIIHSCRNFSLIQTPWLDVAATWN